MTMTTSLKINLFRFSGIFLILAYIYLRFIRKRIQSDLFFIQKINDNEYVISLFLIFLCVMFLITSSVGIYIFVKQIRKQPINVPNNLITILLAKIILFIQTSLKAVEAYIGDNVEDSYTKVRSLILKFYNKYKYSLKYIFIICYCIPYSITSIIFIMEIFIYFKLNIFYKILPLLLIPISLFVWFYLIEMLTNNLYTIRDKFDITHNKLPDGRDQIVVSRKPNMDLTNDEYIQYNNEYLLLLPLEGFLVEYKIISEYYKPRILLFMNLCFLGGWLYILIYNIYYIYYIY